MQTGPGGLKALKLVHPRLGWTKMALLIKADELKGLISIPEAVAAVRDGFCDQGEKPAYSAPRIRIQYEDRRVSVHPGGCIASRWRARSYTSTDSHSGAVPSNITGPARASMWRMTAKPRN